jgi:Xaa-Pro aminopeptidase
MVPDLPMKEKLSKDRRSNLSKEIRKNSGKIDEQKGNGKIQEGRALKEMTNLTETMELRRSRVLKGMEEQGLDGLFLMGEANIRYVSGFTGGDSYVLFTTKKRFFITDSRYTEQAEQECFGFEIVEHRGNSPGLEETVARLCSEYHIKKIGFEQNFVTYEIYEKLSRALKEKTDLVPTSGMVEEARLVKDEGEIALIRKAAEIADETFTYVLGLIKPGIKEKDIEIELEYQMKKNGASGTAFPTIVASGPRGSLPHALPSQRIIKQGDFITLDFGAVYQGYCSDITRTVCVGEPNQKQKEIYHIVKKAQEKGLQSLRAGIMGKDADKLVRNVIEKAGYGSYFGHGLGHGVGLEIHEEPFLNKRSEKVLTSGAVVTVEPGIYLPNWGGLRIEDTVLVTQKGCETLTHSPKELIVL